MGDNEHGALHDNVALISRIGGVWRHKQAFLSIKRSVHCNRGRYLAGNSGDDDDDGDGDAVLGRWRMAGSRNFQHLHPVARCFRERSYNNASIIEFEPCPVNERLLAVSLAIFFHWTRSACVPVLERVLWHFHPLCHPSSLLPLSSPRSKRRIPDSHDAVAGQLSLRAKVPLISLCSVLHHLHQSFREKPPELAVWPLD